jgi:hypothetical protein
MLDQSQREHEGRVEPEDKAGDPSVAPSPTVGVNRGRWLMALLLLLGVLLTAFFGLRTARSFRVFNEERGRPPREASGELEPWMTIPYVAAAWQVPESYLYEQLGIEGQGNERKPLMRLERIYFDGQRGALRNKIRDAIERHYAGGVVPTPVLPDLESLPEPEGPAPGGPGDFRGQGLPRGDGAPPSEGGAP